MVISSEDPDQLCSHRAQAVLQAMKYHTGDTLEDFPLVEVMHPGEFAKLRRLI